MINAGCLSRRTIGINLCLHQLQIISFSTNCAHLKENKLCFQWKKASKTHGVFLAAAMTSVVPSENTLELIEHEKNMDSDVKGNCGSDEKEIDPKEAKRRMRIGKANKGKVAWNKGRKHSPETIARIKERTKQAMQNPKMRLKLSLSKLSRAASESKERKEEIRTILRGVWEVRRKRSLLQHACIVEWKESIAESARRGGDGEDELHWDSYNILREDMHREWLQAVATNKSIKKEHRCMEAAKSTEQRPKIAESIKAKWTDPEYQKKVMNERQEALKPNCLMVPKKRVAMEDIERENSSRPRNQMVKNISGDGNCKDARELSIPWNKLPLSYSDPQAGAKLQMIQKIRANRAAMELEKREATERAMLLIAEAEKAAKALESAAICYTSVQAFVLETHKLIDEAIHSMQTAESGKSANTPMSERVFSRPTYTDVNFMDRSEVADPAISDCGDNYGVHRPSLTKSRKICENTPLACKSETPSRSEISRSLYHYSHESGHSISSPKIGSSQVTGSINSSIGSELEGIHDAVSEADGKFSVERNAVGENSTLTDKQGNPDWKDESRPPAVNITKDIISSIIHNMNLFLPGTGYSVHGIDGKSQVKYEKKKKWVRGRLIEAEED